MTEQKRPVLTLKRKTEGETPTRSRKTIINVTTPPKWKVKKQKLAEKAAREAELTAKSQRLAELDAALNMEDSTDSRGEIGDTDRPSVLADLKSKSEQIPPVKRSDAYEEVL